MGQLQLYANNASTTIAGAITNVSVTVALASGAGALFPHPAAGQFFIATFTDEATGLLNEIVQCTNVTGDEVTIVRGQEGTAAQNWNAGDLFNLLVTAGGLEKFQQDVEAQSGTTNSAVDTGAANAYVVALTPTLTAHVPLMPIWWQASHGNTGASTFNDGTGSLPLVNPDGTALGSGTIVANGIYGAFYDGAGHFQMITASNEALSSQGIATTGDVKWRPTTETIPGWLPACGPTATIGNATSGANLRANADTLALFTWLWTNFSNSQCPVLPSGRGASATADFNANKTIGMIDMRGSIMGGMDTMGGFASTNWSNVPVVSGSATTAGSVLGANTAALTLSQLPTGITSTLGGSGSLSLSQSVIAGTSALNGGVSTGGGGGGVAFNGGAGSPTVISSFTASYSGGTATSNNTSGTVHSNAQLTMIGTMYVKQ
jgi:hypothetical protein